MTAPAVKTLRTFYTLLDYTKNNCNGFILKALSIVESGEQSQIQQSLRRMGFYLKVKVS